MEPRFRIAPSVPVLHGRERSPPRRRRATPHGRGTLRCRAIRLRQVLEGARGLAPGACRSSRVQSRSAGYQPWRGELRLLAQLEVEAEEDGERAADGQREGETVK